MSASVCALWALARILDPVIHGGELGKEMLHKGARRRVRHSATLALVFVAVLLTSGRVAWTHPGGLNADGCHTNRKTGDYHCHRAASSSVARQAASHAASGNVHYRNCDEARAAGAAPIRRGQPGYAPHLDRDDDGIACEPYKGK